MINMRDEIKKEIARLTNNANWAWNVMDKLVDEAMALLDSGKAKTVEQAAYHVVDERY